MPCFLNENNNKKYFFFVPDIYKRSRFLFSFYKRLIII